MMSQDNYYGGELFSHLTNYCYRMEKGHKNAVADPLAAWLAFDKLSYKFENIGWTGRPPCLHRHIPASTQAYLQLKFS